MYVCIISKKNNLENYSCRSEEIIQINLCFTLHIISILKVVTIYKIQYPAHKGTTVEV